MVISIIVASKVSSGKNGFKYFIGYKNAKKIRALCIFFQTWINIEDILIKLDTCLFW